MLTTRPQKQNIYMQINRRLGVCGILLRLPPFPGNDHSDWTLIFLSIFDYDKLVKSKMNDVKFILILHAMSWRRATFMAGWYDYGALRSSSIIRKTAQEASKTWHSFKTSAFSWERPQWLDLDLFVYFRLWQTCEIENEWCQVHLDITRNVMA